MFKLTGVYKPKQVEKKVETQEVKSTEPRKKTVTLVISAKIQYIDNDFYAITEERNRYKIDKASRSTENKKIIYLNVYKYPRLKPTKIIRDKDNLRALADYYIPFKVE